MKVINEFFVDFDCEVMRVWKRVWVDELGVYNYLRFVIFGIERLMIY